LLEIIRLALLLTENRAESAVPFVLSRTVDELVHSFLSITVQALADRLLILIIVLQLRNLVAFGIDLRFEKFLHQLNFLLDSETLNFVLFSLQDLSGSFVERDSVLIEFVWVHQSRVRCFPIDVWMEGALAHLLVLLLSLQLFTFFLLSLVLV
jgi:hypothetical protein